MQSEYKCDIAAWVAEKKWLAVVQAHVSPVMHEGGCYVLVQVERGHTSRLKGVTALMAESVYHMPTERPRRALNVAAGYRRRGRVTSRGGKKKALAPEFSAPTPGLASRDPMYFLGGAMRGSMIHRQIENAVLLDEENFLRLNPSGMHVWTQKILTYLVSRDMRPFKSEFIVYDAAIKCATKVDLVAVDRSGCLVFIENKTGYAKGVWKEADHGAYWLPQALNRRADFPCSPRNRAVVQAVLGAIMAARMLRLPSTAYRACVLRINEHDTDYIPIQPKFLAEVGVAVYEHITASRQQVLTPATGTVSTGRKLQ